MAFDIGRLQAEGFFAGQCLFSQQSPNFKTFKDPCIDSTESIPFENYFRRGIDFREVGGEDPNEVDSSFKKFTLMGHSYIGYTSCTEPEFVNV